MRIGELKEYLSRMDEHIEVAVLAGGRVETEIRARLVMDDPETHENYLVFEVAE
jgi:hypothetical protein